MLTSGACITGETRTLFAPCVGERLKTNLLLPLKLRTHVFVHGGNVTVRAVETLFHGVDLAVVDARTNEQYVPPKCSTQGSGYVITQLLARCYDSIINDAKYRYDWVFRLRTDHNVPFRLAQLPLPDIYKPKAGVILLGGLAQCDCGWKKRSCTREPKCGWADDQFAMLHGAGISLYLKGLRVRFCEPRARRPLASEERVGRILTSHRTIAVRDIRFISSALHPRLQRSSSCAAPMDGRLPNFTVPTFDVPLESFQQPIPSGPWDQRRHAVCARGRGWCLLNGPVRDDLLFPAELSAQVDFKRLRRFGL